MKSLMRSILALMAIMASFHTVQAQVAAGGQDGNGGDSCERSFKVTRDDIASWITRGGSAGLQFPAALTLEQYNMTMQVALRNARVSCTTNEIRVRRQPKTCRNFYDQGEPKIECNHQRFLQTPEAERHVLVHHEYAGLAGLEVTAASGASNYHLSNQLSSFLEDHVVKRLRVGPPPPQNYVALPDTSDFGHLPIGTIFKMNVDSIIPPQSLSISLRRKSEFECHLTSSDFRAESPRGFSGVLELRTLILYNFQERGWRVEATLNGRRIQRPMVLTCSNTTRNGQTRDIGALRELFSDPYMPGSVQIPLIAPFQ